MAKKALTIAAADLMEARSARSEAKEPGEPLNFRVPPDFSQQFRIYAVQRRMKLSDVLIEAFTLLKETRPQ